MKIKRVLTFVLVILFAAFLESLIFMSKLSRINEILLQLIIIQIIIIVGISMSSKKKKKIVIQEAVHDCENCEVECDKPTIPEISSESTEVEKEEEEEEEENEFKYIGSKEQKKYHLSTCRFASSIDEKHAIESNDRKIFTSKKFTACKICKPNKK